MTDGEMGEARKPMADTRKTTTGRKEVRFSFST